MRSFDPPTRRPPGRTKQINMRLDVTLIARLQAHAPGQWRSVSNLITKFIADGLDRLDAERPPAAPRQTRPNHLRPLAR